MRRRLLPALLLAALSTTFSACEDGPKVTVEISDPAAGGFQTYDEATGRHGFLSYADSRGHVAFSPPDAQTLLNYCVQP